MAHDDEVSAFRAYLRQYGSASILLVDTYDTPEGVRRAVTAMQAEAVVARAIRIDSGDLGGLATLARAILDGAGFTTVQVLASGDLDEDRIAALVAADAPIDAFGVGTQLGTSADAPYLAMVYKLVEQAGEPRLKLSPGKHTLPGRKQVWRSADGDVVALDHEPPPTGARPLLGTVFDGRPTGAVGSLADARDRCAVGLASWDDRAPVVRPSAALAALTSEVAATRG
jgi:nicotinate phosphoribosyltransferase